MRFSLSSSQQQNPSVEIVIVRTHIFPSYKLTIVILDHPDRSLQFLLLHSPSKNLQNRIFQV
jgi:hypothetical protein